MAAAAVEEPQRAAGSSSCTAPLDLPERLLVAASFVAPMNLSITGALTVFDLAVIVVAFLVMLGPRRLHPLPRPVAVAGWLFLFMALISTFRASYPAQALTQTAQLAFAWFVLLPVLLTLARSRRVVVWSIIMVMAGEFFSIVLAIASPAVQGAHRHLIFFSDNPNRLGYPAAYLLPFCAYFVAGVWRRGQRLVALVVGIPLFSLLLWALTASASRSAMIGTIVAITVYFLLRPKLRPWQLGVRLLVIGAVSAVVVLLLMHSQLFPLTLQDRISRTLDPLERTELVGDREALALAGWRAFLESPLVGTGLDNFRYVSYRYVDGVSSQAPHNLWIQFLAQVGIVGTVAFAWLMLFWFSKLLGSHRRALDPRDRALAWAFVASMSAIVALYMLAPIMIDRHYWLLFGLGLAFSSTLVSTPSRTDSGGPGGH